MMTTEHLPDGRWAATVEAQPWATVTAYGATEAEAIQNAKLAKAKMEENHE